MNNVWSHIFKFKSALYFSVIIKIGHNLPDQIKLWYVCAYCGPYVSLFLKRGWGLKWVGVWGRVSIPVFQWNILLSWPWSRIVHRSQSCHHWGCSPNRQFYTVCCQSWLAPTLGEGWIAWHLAQVCSGTPWLNWGLLHTTTKQNMYLHRWYLKTKTSFIQWGRNPVLS